MAFIHYLGEFGNYLCSYFRRAQLVFLRKFSPNYVVLSSILRCLSCWSSRTLSVRLRRNSWGLLRVCIKCKCRAEMEMPFCGHDDGVGRKRCWVTQDEEHRICCFDCNEVYRIQRQNNPPPIWFEYHVVMNKPENHRMDLGTWPEDEETK